MNGLELTRELRARLGKRIKIILMSASVLTFNRDDAFAAGCDDFLPKPFRELDLLHRLGQALHLRWRTEDTPDVTGGSPRRLQPFGSASPFPPPTGVVEELLAIARRGDVRLLRTRIAALRATPSGHDEFLHTIELLAGSYQMDRIRQTLERAQGSTS